MSHTQQQSNNPYWQYSLNIFPAIVNSNQQSREPLLIHIIYSTFFLSGQLTFFVSPSGQEVLRFVLQRSLSLCYLYIRGQILDCSSKRKKDEALQNIMKEVSGRLQPLLFFTWGKTESITFTTGLGVVSHITRYEPAKSWTFALYSVPDLTLSCVTHTHHRVIHQNME